MTAGQNLSPPLAKITPNDRRGILWTIEIICLAFIYLTLALRVAVRWRRWQPDDYALWAASFLVLVEAAVAFGAIGMGLGTSRFDVDSIWSDIAWQLFIASETLYVIASFVVKAAVLCTVEKLLAQNIRERRIFRFTLAVVAAMGVASVLAISIDCSGRTCNQQPRWIAVATMDGISDIWGFALFCRVIFSLQMRMSLKFTSIAILGLRLFCLAFTAVHAYFVSTFDKAPSPAVAVIAPLVWQQLALTWSLLSAMAVPLRPFIRELHTGMGMDMANIDDGTFGPGTARRSFRMRDVWSMNISNMTTSSRGSKLKRALADNQDVRDMENGLFADVTMYPRDDMRYSAAIYHDSQRKPSDGSTPSQEPIIRRDVEYTVTYEDA